MANWIEGSARQRAVRLVVMFLVVTGVVALLFAWNADYWKVFFSGPPAVDQTALDAAAATVNSPTYVPIATPYATVTGKEVLTTNVQEVTTYESVVTRVSAGYYALLVGDKVLIVKSAKEPSTTVSGVLTGMPSDLQQELLPADADPAEKEGLYPLLLDTNYRESGYVSFLWAGLVELFFGVPAFVFFRRLTGAKEFTVVKRTQEWGHAEIVSEQVQRELRDAVLAKSKEWTMTQNYFVKRAIFSFDVFRVEDLLWTYKQVTRRRVNFFPVGKSYSLVLSFPDRQPQIEGKEAKVDEMLAILAKRAPWAVFGFDKETQTLYTRSKAEFVAEVQERKAALKEQVQGRFAGK